jgi:hypothetical protein
MMSSMHELITRCFALTPRNLVRGGLAMFFLGTGLLLAAVAAQVVPAALAWFVPQDALGYTAAATLVCWGVWAMGAGLRQVREATADGRTRTARAR